MSSASHEIELRFLVEAPDWPRAEHPHAIDQGYLTTDPARVVRIRLRDGEDGFLTIKGRAKGAKRLEFEVPVPAADARALLELAVFRVTKRRHVISVPPYVWEIDEFEGRNAGLVVAEVELGDEAQIPAARAARPAWAGLEITAAHEYSNLRLAERPFVEWSEAERKAILGTEAKPQ